MPTSGGPFRVVCPECDAEVVEESYEKATERFDYHAKRGCEVVLQRIDGD